MVRFAPGERYWRYDPASRTAAALTQEQAEEEGHADPGLDPAKPFLVRARSVAEAVELGRDWRHAQASGADTGARLGELPGARGSFYFAMRD